MRDADACSDRGPDCADRVGRGELLQQPAGEGSGLIQPGVGQREGKLVAAQSCRNVGGPARLADADRNVTQELVACCVAIRVVHGLEPIEVDEENAELPGVSPV